METMKISKLPGIKLRVVQLDSQVGEEHEKSLAATYHPDLESLCFNDNRKATLISYP